MALPLIATVRIRGRYRQAETPPRSGFALGARRALRVAPGLLAVLPARRDA